MASASGPARAAVTALAPPAAAALAAPDRATVLLALEDALGALEDPAGMWRLALGMIGRRLGADRVVLAEGARVLHAWGAAAPGPGEAIAEADAGPLRERLGRGEAVVLAADGEREGPWLLLPVPREDGPAELLWIAPARPGEGAPGEAALAREMVERTRAAAARAWARARLRAEEAEARARAEELAATYATAPVGLCVLDREGRYLRVNEVLAAENGLPVAAHLGRRVGEVLPDLSPALGPVLARALAGEEIRGLEVTGQTPGRPGVPRIWRQNWMPLRDAEGGIVGVTVSVEEITGERAAERRQAFLLRLEDRLRAAADAGEALDAVCELLGRELGARSVSLGWIEEDGGPGLLAHEWRAEGEAELGGQGDGPPAGTAGGGDAGGEDRPGDTGAGEARGAPDASAFVEVPLLRGGRRRGALRVAEARPRAWTPEEVALVREAAGRAWEAAERAGAEARLRESEARFRQLAETIREVFYVLEIEEGRMSYVSPAYEEIWGRSLEEVLADARSFLGAVHPEDRERVRASTDRLWRGEPVTDEYRILRPDGGIRYIRDRAALVTDPATGRRRAFGLAADVTAGRRVEERLSLATEAAGTGIFDVDLLADTIEWDARLRALWGIGPEVVVNDAVFAGGLHPEDVPNMRAAVARAVDPAGDGLYRAEYRLRQRDGEPVRWIAAAGRVHFAEGRAVRLIGTVQDISERKRAEAAVARSEARFRTLADTLPALIFIGDAEGRNAWVNGSYGAYTGLPPDRLLGEGWRQVAHPADLRQADRQSAARRGAGEPHVTEMRLRRADGAERWHLVRSQPVREAGGAVLQWVGAATDIQEIVEAREAMAAGRTAVEQANAALEARVAERTASLAEANARLAAEIERREAVQAALVQSQKLEAVGQLTSGIAHDFNNVIAAIAGGFSVIERRTQDPRLLEIARHGAKAAERGGTLVRQLLAFARQQVLTPRPCDLRALLAEAEPLILRSLGPRVALGLEVAEGLAPVRVDPVQLEAALINLAVNARDAMPEGGRVAIAARPSPPGEAGRPAELGPAPAVALSIADSGTGMAPEVLARVLDPFFTTKAPGRGTGLGLAMVHGFVHQSGGALRIESREGEGTTVTLWLPEAGAACEEPPEPEPDPPAARSPAPGTTVLLVDDDEAVRGVTAAQLADLGYEVAEAGGAEEALALLAAGGRFDVVLTDVAMPGADGVELAAELRRRRPGLPILFMTGHADRTRLAGEAVLDKPFALGALARALADRLREGG